jgi:hypothetical protein
MSTTWHITAFSADGELAAQEALPALDDDAVRALLQVDPEVDLGGMWPLTREQAAGLGVALPEAAVEVYLEPLG